MTAPSNPFIQKFNRQSLLATTRRQFFGRVSMGKLFNEQFTTKPVGKGTGIGLGSVKQLVTHARGAVRLATKVGQGTTFTLTLPVTLLTLGLFIFVLNGLMFWGVAALVSGFAVAGFWWGVAGAIAYSIVSWALSSLLLK